MKTLAGTALIAFALLMCLSQLSDIFADLKQWHDATTPTIVAAMLKSVANVGMAAVGGWLVPVPGAAK